MSNISGQSLSGLDTTSKTEPLVQNETVLIQPTTVLAGETFRITTSGAYSKDKLFITIFNVSYTTADGFNVQTTIRCSGKA